MKPHRSKISTAPRGGGAAFGGGGHRAFRDPTTMVAPDQAFSAAMSKTPGAIMPPAPAPQGGAGGPAMPAIPQE